jgi:hypothetical protein
MHLRIRIVLRFGTVQIDSALNGGARADGRRRLAVIAAHVFILTQLVVNSSKIPAAKPGYPAETRDI